jgi:hypothetical protein
MDNDALWGSITLPPTLKEDFEATVFMGTTKIFFTVLQDIGFSPCQSIKISSHIYSILILITNVDIMYKINTQICFNRPDDVTTSTMVNIPWSSLGKFWALHL